MSHYRGEFLPSCNIVVRRRKSRLDAILATWTSAIYCAQVVRDTLTVSLS